MQGGLRPPSPARAVLRRAPLAATGGSHASTLRTLVKEKRPKEEEGRPPARAYTCCGTEKVKRRFRGNRAPSKTNRLAQKKADRAEAAAQELVAARVLRA